MRNIPGVPLVYVNRSVMIMEPMAEKTEFVREQDERGKLRAGLKGRRGAAGISGAKRKRDDEQDDDGESPADGDGRSVVEAGTDVMPKKRKIKGPKGPNPLSVKKSKKPSVNLEVEEERKIIRKAAKDDPQASEKAANVDVTLTNGETSAATEGDPTKKRRRRRKHNSGAVGNVEQPEARTSLQVDEG